MKPITLSIIPQTEQIRTSQQLVPNMIPNNQSHPLSVNQTTVSPIIIPKPPFISQRDTNLINHPLPVNQTTVSPIIIPKTTFTSQKDNLINHPLPVNQTVVSPITIPAPTFTIGMSQRGPKISTNTAPDPKKIEYQKMLNRENQRRFQEKTKVFVNLARMPDINDRMKQLWLISYPNSFDNIDPQIIDNIITQFITSMYTATAHNFQ